MTLEEKLDQVPDRPGVYLYKDAKAQVIYIGKAASLRSRVRSYFQESRAARSEDGRPGRADPRPRLHRDRQRARGAHPRVEPGQEAPPSLQHHPARRQALPVPAPDDRRGVPAPRGRAPGPEGRLDLLRSVLPGDGDAPDAPARAPALPAADLSHQDRRHAAAPVPAVLHPPLPRPVHGLGDARGIRQDGPRGGALPGRGTTTTSPWS